MTMMMMMMTKTMTHQGDREMHIPRNRQRYYQELTLFCGAGFEGGVSNDIVTGPSFWMWTCIYAPNFPSEQKNKVTAYYYICIEI